MCSATSQYGVLIWRRSFERWQEFVTADKAGFAVGWGLAVPNETKVSGLNGRDYQTAQRGLIYLAYIT